MVLNIINNKFHYEMEKLTMAFFPFEKITVIKDEPYDFSVDKYINVIVKDSEVTVSYFFDGTTTSKSQTATNDQDLELIAARLLYDILHEVTGITLGWGVLTGVRPSKLMNKLMDSDGADAALDYFCRDLYVSRKKAELAQSVAKMEEAIMATSTENSFSLYVSIPFCPSRCSYCSFVSHAITSPSAKKLMPVYFKNLLIEIEKTGEIAKEQGLRLESIYIGGGTPSTLTAEQTKTLLEKIEKNFDMSTCREFTFEAGRPDTITEEKLQVLANSPVDRISINPQTLSNDVLEAIGRKHTSEQVIDAYNLARRVGIKNINMDLIVGLPKDTPEKFENTLKKILELAPESVTVHTLAYKRSSNLEATKDLFESGDMTSKMVDTSTNLLYNNDYVPYYMYRQTKSVGNLENVGWSKPSFESYYNVYMMEECHTILACGAGAVTKLKAPDGPEIERIFNFKYPYEYNERFNELMNRKKAVADFYGRRKHGRK